MLFNDYPFLLVFLPAALLIYRLVDPYPSLRIGVQVALSLAFYAGGSPSFILLLIASIVINWLASVAYGGAKWKAVVTLVIALDIGVLALFKYANFILGNLGHVLGVTLPTLDIGLPLGISFFTFHHIMYLVDLKRGNAPLYAATPRSDSLSSDSSRAADSTAGAVAAGSNSPAGCTPGRSRSSAAAVVAVVAGRPARHRGV